MAFALFLLAAIFGLALGARVGWEVVGVGVVCMLIAWSYSGGPFPLSRLPIGEVFAGGAMGLVLTALAAYVQTGAVDARTAALGLPASFLIAAILAANNACDRVGDAAAGRRTLAIVVGERGAARVVEALVAAGYAFAFALAFAGVLPWFAALPLLAAAAVSARMLAAMRARGYAHRTKQPSMAGISIVFLAYTASVAGSLAFCCCGTERVRVRAPRIACRRRMPCLVVPRSWATQFVEFDFRTSPRTRTGFPLTRERRLREDPASRKQRRQTL